RTFRRTWQVSGSGRTSSMSWSTSGPPRAVMTTRSFFMDAGLDVVRTLVGSKVSGPSPQDASLLRNRQHRDPTQSQRARFERAPSRWVDWIRAKAHLEPSTLVLRTRNSGKEGAFDGYCRL